jgi:hypothetical protein
LLQAKHPVIKVSSTGREEAALEEDLHSPPSVTYEKRVDLLYQLL